MNWYPLQVLVGDVNETWKCKKIMYGAWRCGKCQKGILRIYSIRETANKNSEECSLCHTKLAGLDYFNRD